ncbi:uncharacterized protein LOC142339736 [Convolutriloba macropyga]|uniref:uncharacterized protein LOC142339736 n=1 Tax=Convolutriloba macropyga TaxID=536237 RepID=UPI003F5273D5
MGGSSSRGGLPSSNNRISLENDLGSTDGPVSVYFTDSAINLLTNAVGPLDNNQSQSSIDQAMFDKITAIAYQRGINDSEKRNLELFRSQKTLLAREREAITSQREQWSQDIVEKFKKELTADLERTSSKFSQIDTQVVCEKEQADVMSCYIENKENTLNCEKQVNLFDLCVQMKRKQMKTPAGGISSSKSPESYSGSEDAAVTGKENAR